MTTEPNLYFKIDSNTRRLVCCKRKFILMLRQIYHWTFMSWEEIPRDIIYLTTSETITSENQFFVCCNVDLTKLIIM